MVIEYEPNERYNAVKDLINKKVKIKAIISKYGGPYTDLPVVAIRDIKIEGSDIVIDHLWVVEFNLYKLKLPHGKRIELEAIIRPRKRAGYTLNKGVLDIQLTKVKLQKNRR